MAASYSIDFIDHHPVDLGDLAARQRVASVKMGPKIDAVDPRTYQVINFDIPAAVVTVLGRMPRIRSYREPILQNLSRFDITQIDELEDAALALGHAHTQLHASSEPAEAVAPLAETLLKSRDFLLSDATALAKREIIDGDRLNELQGTNGYRNTTFDVLLLVSIFRDNWEQIGGRTAVKQVELDQAEGLANRLVEVLGAREAGTEGASDASVRRQAAYTLFVDRHNQVRRAITYLRWDIGDTDQIIPSLYAGRNRKKADDAAPAAPTPAPVTGASGAPNGSATPAPSPAAPAAPAASNGSTGNGSNANGSTGANGTALPPAASLIGLPGDTPFNR